MKRIAFYLLFLLFTFSAAAQLNTDRIVANGRAALYFKDYFLSIQYFNQVIKIKPFLSEPYMYRGFAKLYLEEFRGAEADCSSALNINPFLTDAYICRAYARLGLNNFDGAATDFEKAMELLPDNASLLTSRAAVYVEQKQYETAMSDYNLAIGKEPKNKFSYYERGRLHFLMNDTTGAYKDFTKVIELDKFSAMGWSARGLLNLQSKNYKEAVSDLNEAIIFDEKKAGNYINRALAKYMTKDLRGAMTDYDRALELDPNEFLGYFNRGLLRAQVGDNNRAIEDFDMVLRFDPDEYTAILNRAMLRMETGDILGAIDDYSAIIKRYPNFYPAYFSRSEALAKIGKKKEAELDYMTAIHVENEERKKNENKQFVAETETREETDDDLHNYKKIVVIDTEKERNKLQYQNNELRGTIQDVNVDIEPEQNFFLSYYVPEKQVNRFHFYKKLDEYNRSQKQDNQLKITNEEMKLSTDLVVLHLSYINELSQRIEENPLDYDAYFFRAVNFGLIQDFENSIESYNKAVALNPDFMLAYFNRANTRTKLLDYESSKGEENQKQNSVFSMSKLNSEFIIKDYNKVVELEPNFIYGYFNRGNFYFLNNDFTSAITDYSIAIAIEPDLAEAYFNRGLAYILQGDKKKGLIDLSKAGELGIVAAYNIIKRYS
jgi:tetratricopeptide (TPR) repeat protein